MSKFIFLFTLLCTTLFAQQDAEEFHFIGATLATDSIDFKTTPDISSQDETTFGIRYGRQTLDWRTVFTLSGNKDLQTIALEVDKILLDELFGTPKIRPYLGATIGYMNYDNIPAYEENPSSSDHGYYYGGNLGFLLYTTATIDVDISYHYYKVADIEPLDTMQGASLSIHYFY